MGARFCEQDGSRIVYFKKINFPCQVLEPALKNRMRFIVFHLLFLVFSEVSFAFEVLPTEIEVSNELLENPLISVELTTNLEDGVLWQAISDQPFVTISNPTGTAPESLQISINQIELATFLSDKDERTGALVRISTNGETIEIPIKLQRSDFVIREFYHSSESRSLIFRSQFGTSPIRIVKIQAPTGLVEEVFEIPTPPFTSSFDTEGTRIFFPNFGEDGQIESNRRVLNLGTFEEEHPFIVPDGAGWVGLGKDFVLLRGGPETLRGEESLTGLLFTYDLVSRSIVHVFNEAESKLLEGNGITVAKPHALDGGIFVIKTPHPQGLSVYRITREALVTELVDPNFQNSPENFLGSPSPLVAAEGNRIFFKDTIIDLKAKRIRPLALPPFASDRQGRLVVDYFSVSYVDSDLRILELDGRGLSVPGAFTSNDEFLLLNDTSKDKQIRFIRPSSIASFPVPVPAPEENLFNDFPTFSAGAVVGALSYRYFLSHPFNGVSISLEGSEPTFQLPEALPRGYTYQWQIDAVTSSGTLPGTVWNFELTFEPSLTLSGLSSPKTDGKTLGFFDKDDRAEFRSIGKDGTISPATSVILESTGTLDPGYASMVAGDKAFENSNDGLRIFRRRSEGFYERDGLVPIERNDPGTHFGAPLAASGGLIFVGSAAGPLDQARIEVYRVMPEVVHDGTIELPALPERSTPTLRDISIATAGDIAVITLQGDRDASPRLASLFVYQRIEGTGDWILRDTFENVSNPRLSPPSVSTDGRTIAMIYNTPRNSGELIIYKRRANDEWEEVQRLGAHDNSLPFLHQPNPITVKNGMMVLAVSNALAFLRESDDAWTVESSLRARDFPFGLTNPIAVHGDLLTSNTERRETVSIFRDVFPTNGVPRFEKEAPSEIIVDSDYLYEIRGFPAEVALILEQAPAWLSLAKSEGGFYVLEGTSPPQASTETVRLRASGPSGFRDYQIFDLEILPDLTPLSAAIIAKGGLSATEGDTLTLSAEASGDGSLSYQWLKDGLPLPGEERPVLNLRGVEISQNSSYSVQISNSKSLITSEAVEVVITPSTIFGRNWTMSGADEGRRSFIPATLGTSEPLLKWSKSQVTTSPVIQNGRIYLTINPNSPGENRAIAFGLEDGEEIWSYNPGSDIILTQPAVAGESVFFGGDSISDSNAGWALSLNSSNGALNWQRELNPNSFAIFPQASTFKPLVASDRVWFNFDTLQVQSYTTRGEGFFVLETPASDNGIAFSNGTGYLATFRDFHKFNTLDGMSEGVFNRAPSSSHYNGNSLAIDGDRAVFVDSRDLVSFDLLSQVIRWTAIPDQHENQVFGAYREIATSGDFVLASNWAIDRVRDPDTGENYVPAFVDVLRSGDGEKIGTVPVRIPASPTQERRLEILLLNDSFVISAGQETTIYDIATFEIRSTIPHSGFLAYGEGHLIINDPGGRSSDAGLYAYRINDRPDLVQPEVAEAFEDQSSEVNLTSNHLEAEEGLTYELLTPFDWLTLTPEGLLTVRPTQEDIGEVAERTQEYTLRVSDGVTTPVEQTFEMRLVAVNDLPVFGLVGIFIYDEDDAEDSIDLASAFSDEESLSSSLVFGLTKDESGSIASVALNDAKLTILPLTDQFGVFGIELEVSDPDGGRILQDLLVVINPVNDPPEHLGTEVFTTALPDASDQTLSLGDTFFDRDPGDELRFTLSSNNRPELFESLTLDGQTGELVIKYAPYISGVASLSVVASDLEGEQATLPVQVTLSPPADPTVLAAGQPGVESQIALNPQTGLFEQKVTLTNNAARAIGGFSVTIAGLTDGFRLYQSSPSEVIYGEPIAVGESVELTLEYYSAESGKRPTPSLTVVPILPQPQESAETLGVVVDQVTTTTDGAVLLEFASEENGNYVVQYSFDMTTWFNSPSLVGGQLKSTQWLDQGLPRTRCHPRDCQTRFYRVLKIVTSE